MTMAESMSTSSHTMRFLASVSTGVLRYVSSDGAIPAMISKSSVFSSWMTSTASSIVMMPTSRFSLSTTGMASRS